MNRTKLRRVRNRTFALWKYLLSFRKSDWQLSDYPVRIRKQKTTPDLPSRFKQHASAASVLNWHLSGNGDSPQKAREALQQNFDKVTKRLLLEGKKQVRPGVEVPLEFASQERIDLHQELSQDVIKRVLKLDGALISDESSLWDFHFQPTNDLLNSRILEIYGLDVSDIRSGNLAEILDRIAAKRTR